MDVARPHLPAALPLLWTRKLALGPDPLHPLTPPFSYLISTSSQFWQLFNALTLFNLARDPECKEWQVREALGKVWGDRDLRSQSVLTLLLPQVLMCGFPFLLLFLGNFFTTLRVVRQKFHSQRQGSKKD